MRFVIIVRRLPRPENNPHTTRHNVALFVFFYCSLSVLTSIVSFWPSPVFDYKHQSNNRQCSTPRTNKGIYSTRFDVRWNYVQKMRPRGRPTNTVRILCSGDDYDWRLKDYIPSMARHTAIMMMIGHFFLPVGMNDRSLLCLVSVLFATLQSLP